MVKNQKAQQKKTSSFAVYLKIGSCTFYKILAIACEKVYAIFSVIKFFQVLEVHRENGDDNLRKQKLMLAIQL